MVSYHGTERVPVYSVDTIFVWIAISISFISALAIPTLYLPTASFLQIDGSEARYHSLQDGSEERKELIYIYIWKHGEKIWILIDIYIAI